jgi:hypothetical protein
MNSGEIVDKDLELFAASASPVKGPEAQNSSESGSGLWMVTLDHDLNLPPDYGIIDSLTMLRGILILVQVET